MAERWGKGRDEISDPSRPQFTLGGGTTVYRCAHKPCKRAGTKGIAFTANLAIAPTYAPCICGREVYASALSHTLFYRDKRYPGTTISLTRPRGRLLRAGVSNWDSPRGTLLRYYGGCSALCTRGDNECLKYD